MTDLEDYPRGTVTFVFTDVEKSTPMTRRLERLAGRGVYEKKLRDLQRARLNAETILGTGREVSRAGDGHLLVFQRAADALACAVALQRSLHAEPITHPEGDEVFEVRVRVGVHTVNLQRDPEPMDIGGVEYQGSDTNFASRVMSLGRGGQIIVSELAAREAASLPGYRLHPWRNRLLKGFEDQAHNVHEILYHDDQEPREPGMQWLPDWYQAEKKLYIERPGKELEVINLFMKEGDTPAHTFARRAGNQGPRIVTIKAEGGMGKTRLAVACAAKVADLFPDGVHFVPLAEVSPSEGAVAEAIGRALGLPGNESQPASILEHLRPRTILLILDNYESMIPPVEAPDQKVARYLARLIGQAHGLRLLVTGRSSVGLVDVEQHVYLDDGMEEEEALALFLDRARLQWKTNRDLTAAERPHWERIRELTDRIPLAIELAAAWAFYPLSEIAKGLADTPLGDQTALPPDTIRFDSETARERHDSLTRSLDWSYNLLGKTAGPKVQLLFQACGLFADSFDAATLAIVADDPTAQTGLIRLQNASLVRAASDDGLLRYRLHRFTREYALRRLDATRVADEVRRRYLAHYVQLVRENASDPNNVAGYDLLDREWQNALVASQLAETIADGPSHMAMIPLGDYLRNRCLWSETEGFHVRCLTIAQAASDRLNEAIILNNLGGFYRIQSRLDEALETYSRSLTIFRGIKDRIAEGRTLGLIGNTRQAQGMYDEALKIHEQSLAICRELKDRTGEGNTLGYMGIAYCCQGNNEKALESIVRSAEICRELKDRIGEGRRHCIMGNILQNLGKYDDALIAYSQDLAICREFKDRDGEGRTLNNMGNVYRKQGLYEKAIDAQAKSLNIFREFKDRVNEGRTLCNLGEAYQNLGRYDESLDAYSQDLNICREFKDRIGEGMTLANLALLEEKQGRLTEAIEWARHAVKVLEATEARPAFEKAQRTLERLEGLAATGGEDAD